MEKVLKPFGARFTASSDKFRPVAIKGIYGDGDVVVAFFDGAGTTNDGKPYTNTYAWFLTLKNGLVVDATAFFDSIAFNDLWSRVTPAP
jgi:ketosteroid isomerase-like protein